MTSLAPAPSRVTWAQLQRQLGLSIPPVIVLNRNTSPVAATTAGSTPEQLMQRSCQDGERTAHLVQLTGSLLASGFALDETIESCHRWNMNNRPPLEDDKVERTCNSIHSLDQRNHPERYLHHVIHEPLFDLAPVFRTP